MSTQDDQLVSPAEMEAIHRGMLDAALHRANLPDVDIGRIARLSLSAYDSQPATSPAAVDTQQRASAALEAMHLRAAAQLDGLVNADDVAGRRRGVASDVFAALVLPAICVACAWFVYWHFGIHAGQVVVGVLALAAGAVACLAYKAQPGVPWLRFLNAPAGAAQFAWWSAGSLAAGSVVIGAGGVGMLKYSETRQEVHLDASTLTLDRAVMWAIAASQAGVSEDVMRRVVERRTQAKWTPTDESSMRVGMLLATVEMPDPTLSAKITLPSGDRARISSLLASLTANNGEKRLSSYLVGLCVQSDLQRFAVQSSAGVRTSFELPKGEAPCAAGSNVVVAVGEQGEAKSVQTIDAAVRDLAAAVR